MQSTPIPTSPPTLGRDGLVGPPTFADTVVEPLSPPRPPTQQQVWVRIVAGLVGSGLATTIVAMSAILALVAASAESSSMTWTDVVVLGLFLVTLGSVAAVPMFFFSTDAERAPLDRWLRAGLAYFGFVLTAAASLSGMVFLQRWATAAFVLNPSGATFDVLDWITHLLVPIVAATFAALWVTEVTSKSRRV